ncbi:MAG: glycoside hydrolase family 65 protein [Gammaproteobacteria bacterium]|nr:glycoside hydrolase family 65 protein [Gammaproteobacteria bacterium]
MTNSFQVAGDANKWIVLETDFDTNFQGKGESIFCLGNGYLGIRSATEESYYGQVRNLFVAGTFNKSNSNEVTELPNAADTCSMDIFLDQERFSLDKGHFSKYTRTLNLKNGELKRSFTWCNSAGKKFRFTFHRFVSMNDLHTYGSKVSIIPLNCQAKIQIKSGINGQVTNSGAQHFEEGEKRIYEKQYLQMQYTTSESGISFVHNTCHSFTGDVQSITSRFEMARRKVWMTFEGVIEDGVGLEFQKVSNVFITRDKDTAQLGLDDLFVYSIDHLKRQLDKGYDVLLEDSSAVWNALWQDMDIEIDSNNNFDQLAIRFAQYHLLALTPKHDSRYGVAAKGLSGEGYKGHSFWDTEIFILPFYTFTFPEIARSLLEYRYHTIDSARKKASDNGYKGAMYPWESAWMKDGEVTPIWGAADVVSGKATKILSGFIEQHITSDVAYAVWQYYMVTGDVDFMKSYGYEILMDTAIFWSSRLEWSEEHRRYHINDVVGPDEYKEHVNNDAFTNYMARWCMENAINYYDELKKNDPQTFDKLNGCLNLDVEIPEMIRKYDQIYLPVPNEDLIIPQDDSYLQKRLIDLSKYKEAHQVDLIFKDYNLDQINEIQVTKQASIVMLMYLLEQKFNDTIKEANFNYYEPKTLHDSSLSLSTHSVLASDLNHSEQAYQLFEKAARIDLGPDMKTSDAGIHAASLGGLWQIVVCGFAGLRMTDGMLRINPLLPVEISSISFPINWKTNPLRITVDKKTLKIQNRGTDMVQLEVFEIKYQVEKEIIIDYSTITKSTSG